MMGSNGLSTYQILKGFENKHIEQDNFSCTFNFQPHIFHRMQGFQLRPLGVVKAKCIWVITYNTCRNFRRFQFWTKKESENKNVRAFSASEIFTIQYKAFFSAKALSFLHGANSSLMRYCLRYVPPRWN